MSAFTDWMKSIDAEVDNRLGVSVHDLPDFAFRDMFDDGLEPEEVADIIAEETLNWT